jgi:YVTN family beta-propeller protein
VGKICLLLGVIVSSSFMVLAQSALPTLPLIQNIHGQLSPKSVVHNGDGLFFAQNMMYRHTVNVYNRKYELVCVIKDDVELKKYGYEEFKGKFKGAPVECAFSHNGKYAWVSNYMMTGGDSTQFVRPGCDQCSARNVYDSSFVYKINTTTFEIESVIKVGAVPKYIQVTPDNSKVLVTNWSSADLSIIDVTENKEVKRIKIGTYPRGIAVDSKSNWAYFAIMGGNTIARLDLHTNALTYFKNVGKSPRHLCISADDQFLYASFNGEGTIGKINLATEEISKVKSGAQPRSMVLSDDGLTLFVVNYADDNFSKINTSTMELIAKTPTKHHPIGITFDAQTNNVWVACYTGYIQVFQDELSVPALAQNNTQSVTEQSRKITSTPVASSKATVTAPTKQTNTTTTASSTKSVASYQGVLNETGLHKHLPYYVIGGAFSNSQNAQKLAQKFQQKGFASFTHENKEKGFVYCVVSACSTQEEAQELMQQLKKSGSSSWVLKAA